MEPLPERIEVEGLVLRRWTPDDVDALHAALLANLDHLRARMPWVADEPLSLADRRARIEGWEEAWRAGGDVVLGAWEQGAVVGSFGLHRRVGPGGLEIGYWVHVDRQGRGVATRGSAALTDLAFSVADVDRVEIHHDASNRASARVPEKLGYTRLPDQPGDPEKQAPADTLVDGIWQVTRAGWTTRPT